MRAQTSGVCTSDFGGWDLSEAPEFWGPRMYTHWEGRNASFRVCKSDGNFQNVSTRSWLQSAPKGTRVGGLSA